MESGVVVVGSHCPLAGSGRCLPRWPGAPMASGGGGAARVINSRGQHAVAMSGLGLGLTHSGEAKIILNLMHSPLQSRKQV